MSVPPGNDDLFGLQRQFNLGHALLSDSVLLRELESLSAENLAFTIAGLTDEDMMKQGEVPNSWSSISGGPSAQWTRRMAEILTFRLRSLNSRRNSSEGEGAGKDAEKAETTLATVLTQGSCSVRCRDSIVAQRRRYLLLTVSVPSSLELFSSAATFFALNNC